ncbi:MAG: SpoIIE family protein phosphatase [Coriobacteriales bacterium]|nr:SpoIIE family protein phosphatase [Coriobacteriales bacterium]
MDPSIIVQFAFATLLPVVAAAGMYLAEQRSKFGKLPYMARQAIIGLLFGGIAILGTEFGIQTPDATMNVRDASPLVAGLLFGGPAGVIAGVVGGVERWFAVLWGQGMFTRVACSLATIAAGLYAALLRKRMFDDKLPPWSLAFAIGIVVEVLHLTLVFVTNMDNIPRAFLVVRACAVLMIPCVAVSVALATLAVTILAKVQLHKDPPHRELSYSIQAGMLVAVALGLVVTTLFTSLIQDNISALQTKSLLELNISDVASDIDDASNEKMLSETRKVARYLGSVEHAKQLDLNEVAQQFDVPEIDVVDEKGIIVACTNKDFVGFDMASGAQSAEFLVLLDGKTTEFVQDYQDISYDSNVQRKYAGVAIDGGFVQVGYDALEFQNAIAQEVREVVRNRHVGESGSLVIADATGMVYGSQGGVGTETLRQTGLADAVSRAKPGEVFTATFYDVPVFAMYQIAEGYRIIALQPIDEAQFSRNVAVLVTMFMEIIVFAGLFTVIYFMVKRVVVDNIHRVNRVLGTITAGNLDASVEVRSNEEFSSLSDDINTMVSALKRAIAEAAARIDAELEYARTIQRSALPKPMEPNLSEDGFAVYAQMDAAKEVGGDFYDYYHLDDNHFAFLVADVSGKGIPAAMFMMKAKTLIKSLAETWLPVDEIFTRANNQLCEGNDAEMFVTAWMGVVELDTGHVVFANAGHNPPVVGTPQGGFEFRKVRPNLVLGGMEGIPYRIYEMDLKPHEIIFLYTDGVTEATNGQNELFGDDRLVESLNEHCSLTMEGLCNAVHKDVDEFVGEAPQFDDITVLALQYEGRKSHAPNGRGQGGERR